MSPYCFQYDYNRVKEVTQRGTDCRLNITLMPLQVISIDISLKCDQVLIAQSTKISDNTYEICDECGTVLIMIHQYMKCR